MALLLRGQGFEKEEFRRLIVLFLTAVDFAAFSYFLWAGLIDKEMLNNSLFFIPAMVLGFIAGGPRIREGGRRILPADDPGDHPGGGISSPPEHGSLKRREGPRVGPTTLRAEQGFGATDGILVMGLWLSN
jgi:hypothetical protein